MGAASPHLVTNDGQWTRMLTSTLLHANPSHLFFNGLALFFAKYLEMEIGAAWYLAIFVLSALGGSALSTLLSASNQVSVGASGAILGLFAAQVVLAYFHFPEGATRTRLANMSWRILIPTLLTLQTAAGTISIDYGAHIGGALTGAIIGAGLSLIWPREGLRPAAQSFAWLINIGACAILVYGVLEMLSNL
jgi:rhomboid protease GluP